MKCYDSAGRRLQLGVRLGVGGEGAVFDITGAPSRVVKLYHKLPVAAKVEKLRAMVSASDPALLKIAAWPLDTVHQTPSGPVAGIVLPKVSGYDEIHLLYSPAHRRAGFPNADWGLLIQAARNVAAAMELVHARGHVVGDVNQKNFTVAADATVKLVDCDSFQILCGRSVHRCEVGVAHFTPPELQGRSFADVLRTPNHDAFGLAVLCFHLLFMGRHPFAGRYLGPGDMPIEKAIQELRFSFGASARQRMMEPPPNALPLAAVPSNVATLFELAFGAANGMRPSPQRWRIALDAMQKQLQTCTRVAMHKFVGTPCTWCELESRGGVIFFLGVAGSPSVFDITASWSAIQSIPSPRALPPLAQPTIHGITPRQLDRRLLFRRRFVAVARFAVALICLPLLPWWATLLSIVLAFAIPLPARDEELHRKRVFLAANEAWNEIQQRWTREHGADAFKREYEHLLEQRDAYRKLDEQYARERAALESARRTRQLDQFLDRFFIDREKIAKIGPGRKATLASYGIETAADVTRGRLSGVPGFGPTLVASLLVWRDGLERRFTFDPAKGVEPQEIARLDQRFAPRRRDLEHGLQAGPARLNALRAQVELQRARLTEDLQVRARAWAQARADLDAMKIIG